MTVARLHTYLGSLGIVTINISNPTCCCPISPFLSRHFGCSHFVYPCSSVLSVCLCLSVSLTLCLSLSLTQSRSPCLNFSVPLSSFSLCLSVSLSQFLCLYVLYVCLSFYPSFTQAHACPTQILADIESGHAIL
jgi:hypothetical protein